MLMETFLKNYEKARQRKNSVLCVGLDPALPQQRKTNTIPDKYLLGKNPNQARLDFCLDIIKLTQDYSCAFKPNQQYVAGFTHEEHRTLTKSIREANAVSILDYKLNDIGDTVESAMYHMHEWGYDALTYNPFLGNLGEAVKIAHEFDSPMGIIALTLTSNPESPKYQKDSRLNELPLFLLVSREIKDVSADGAVVGATGHITAREIEEIRATMGEDKVMLVPGVGFQKGDPSKVLKAGGRNILINVGRDIIYSNDPLGKSRHYQDLLQRLAGTEN
jgi:orotidine 5'-phosphate decarboxylase subfamily 2